MRAHGLVLGTVGFALIGLVASTGCIFETEASGKICVPKQSMTCNDCPPSEDGRPQRGRHTCSDDGKSYVGGCQQCMPISDDGDNLQKPPPIDGGVPLLDPACNGKIGILAGKENAADQQTYSAVYQDEAFRVSKQSGVPMRSAPSMAYVGGSMLVAFRTRDDGLAAATFSSGRGWDFAFGVFGALTDGPPAVVSWGPSTAKAIFHDKDGYYVSANLEGNKWGDTIEIIGSPVNDPPPGGSSPYAVTAGVPGLAGSMVVLSFTDTAGTIHRQQWDGVNWLAKSEKLSTVRVRPFRPTLIAMTEGAYDLVSAYVGNDGLIHASTRRTSGRSSEWSPDMVVHTSAKPIDTSADRIPINGTALAGGRAMVVYRDANRKGWYTVFDPKQQPVWSVPAELLPAGNPTLASTPHVIQDRCGGDAMLAYVEEGRSPAFLRFSSGTWDGPFTVDGMPEATYAAIVAVP